MLRGPTITESSNPAKRNTHPERDKPCKDVLTRSLLATYMLSDTMTLPIQMLLTYDPATNPLNNNEWAFPLFECIHIAGFALSIGTIAIVDLRLLGMGMRRQSA